MCPFVPVPVPVDDRVPVVDVTDREGDVCGVVLWVSIRVQQILHCGLLPFVNAR